MSPAKLRVTWSSKEKKKIGKKEKMKLPLIPMRRSQSLSHPKAYSLVLGLQKPAGSNPTENDTSFPLLSAFCFFNQIKPLIIFSILREEREIGACLLFNSLKALKRTITKNSVYLPGHFSHLMKDRKAVFFCFL